MENPPEYIEYETLKEMSDLFKEEDKILQKYEMLREQIATRATVKSVSEKFGYNPRHFYWCRRRFREEGILGLVDKQPGPKKPYKIKPNIEKRILQLRKKDLSIYEISDELKKENIEITPKSVDTILNKHHKPKKNRGRKSKK
jgi:transposase-like protein